MICTLSYGVHHTLQITNINLVIKAFKTIKYSHGKFGPYIKYIFPNIFKKYLKHFVAIECSHDDASMAIRLTKA